MENTFKEKAEKLYAKYQMAQDIADIYDEVLDRMKWNGMMFHSADEEHEETWFTEPEEDDYNYHKYLAYKEVLKAIENIM